jgi:hypothetical protein
VTLMRTGFWFTQTILEAGKGLLKRGCGSSETMVYSLRNIMGVAAQLR